MCMRPPKPPEPPAPPPPPPPVLEQAAPVMDNGLGVENSVRKKSQGTKKYSTATTAGLGINSTAPKANANGLG